MQKYQLEMIMDKLARIENKILDVQKITQYHSEILTRTPNLSNKNRNILLSLPPYLLRAYLALDSLGTATATDIANVLGSTRPNMASRLKMLFETGYIRKEIINKEFFYYIDKFTPPP